jgi:hypothetical protein
MERHAEIRKKQWTFSTVFFMPSCQAGGKAKSRQRPSILHSFSHGKTPSSAGNEGVFRNQERGSFKILPEERRGFIALPPSLTSSIPDPHFI